MERRGSNILRKCRSGNWQVIAGKDPGSGNYGIDVGSSGC